MVWLLLTSLIAAGGWLGWSHHAVALGRVQAGFGRIQEGLGRYSFGRQGTAGAVNRLRVSPLSGARETSDGATYPSEAVESHATGDGVGSARQRDDAAARGAGGRTRPRAPAARCVAGGGRRGWWPARCSGLPGAAARSRPHRAHRDERRRSISGAGLFNGATRLPQTARDAYETLGINGHVSDATLKKIADALRMSWHPDLAHDDDDRVQREERIKHINLAVELIEAERRATAITAG